MNPQSLQRVHNTLYLYLVTRITLFLPLQEVINRRFPLFLKWRAGAEEVSNEEVQELWGRILTGECKQPGTFSFATLEVLKTLGIGEANTISKVGPFMIEKCVFNPSNRNAFYSKYDLAYQDFLDLEELEILIAKEKLGQRLTLKSGTSRMILGNNGKGLLIKGKGPKANIWIPAYMFTNRGAQIMSLGNFTPNLDYLGEVGEFLKSAGVDVSIVHYKKISEGRFDTIPIRKL